MRLLLISFFFLVLSSVQAQKLSTEKDKFLKQLPKIVESESFLNFVKKDFFKFKNLFSFLKVPEDFLGSNLSSFLFLNLLFDPNLFFIKLYK